MPVPTIVLAEALNIAVKGRVVFDFQRLYQLVRDEFEFEIVENPDSAFDETLRGPAPCRKSTIASSSPLPAFSGLICSPKMG